MYKAMYTTLSREDATNKIKHSCVAGICRKCSYLLFLMMEHNHAMLLDVRVSIIEGLSCGLI